jgi:alanine racemase
MLSETERNNAKRTHIEIDLNAIKHNLTAIRKRIGNGNAILFAVKADGYGHGAVKVSRMAEEFGLCDMFGVSSPQEGIELREAGIKLPVLILGLILPRKDVIDTVLDYDLTQTVADFNLAKEISHAAMEKQKTALLHLKIDTGMGRIGCAPDNALEIGKKISVLENIMLEGIFTHFPVSDEPDSDFTRKQVKIFKHLIEQFEKEDIKIKYKHSANSGGILNYKESIFNMIRPGLIAYGYRPSANCSNSIELIPSMTFKSYIIFNKKVKKGTGLSYGLTYKTKSDTNIATVPVGYGDGYSRFMSNKGKVIINGKLYPVVGRICMDQILIDLGNDEYLLGTDVVLFGKEEITAETAADWIGTVPYEVTCAISKRVQKVYLPASS